MHIKSRQVFINMRTKMPLRAVGRSDIEALTRKVDEELL